MKLRMYFTVYFEEHCTYYREVSSPEEAWKAIDAIAEFMNFSVSSGVIPDHMSFAGLEVFDEEEHDWVDWYDPETGLDFDEYLEEKEKENE